MVLRLLQQRKFDQYFTMTLKRCEIECMSILFTNRKWHTQHCVAVPATGERLLIVTSQDCIMLLKADDAYR